MVEMPSAATATDLNTMAAPTRAALDRAPDVVVQARFFEGEFLGFADFLWWTMSSVACAAERRGRPASWMQPAS